MPLSEGDVFAGYRIVRLLGSGGMGEVYLAEHPRLPRRDALKVLAAEISADADFRARFNREADLASTLWHPNIVGVHDRGEQDGQLWISMDYVNGSDAAHLLSEQFSQGMPPHEVSKIITAIGSALDYAHECGLLHRDVKPANIMITANNQRIVLADFGIARSLDDISGLTATNFTVGTVAYAAPEQLTGEELDGRADQYALAATAYHLLAGRPLFHHSNAAVVIGRHLTSTPPELAQTHPELRALDSVLAVALAKRPDHRFVSCTEFARAFALARVSGAGPRSDTHDPAMLATKPTTVVSGTNPTEADADNQAPSTGKPKSASRPASTPKEKVDTDRPGTNLPISQPPQPRAKSPKPSPGRTSAGNVSRPASSPKGKVGADRTGTSQPKNQPPRPRGKATKPLVRNESAQETDNRPRRQRDKPGQIALAIAIAALVITGGVLAERWVSADAESAAKRSPTESTPSWSQPGPTTPLSTRTITSTTTTTTLSVAVNTIDAADYELSQYPGYYEWIYTSAPITRKCIIFPRHDSQVPGGVECSVPFPPDTPHVSMPPFEGVPDHVSLVPPDGPKNTISEGWPPGGKVLPPMSRIEVGDYSCTSLPKGGIDCSGPTGGFRFEDGTLTKRSTR
ncbi:serine/threonine-protein kinase [Mycobacterium gordonae]|uniref:serine/threonine-protein kinase n=1 Tax=Mycobacterium gordonae TaxID=1778 RepID=UPI0009F34F7B|nr:serine/threonine-protein kinase [Mycobacterium gordonae]MCV7007432.1 protein kinase [Mycobacterium gordonae]